MCFSVEILRTFLLLFPADRTGKPSTMPDSPADVKTQSRLTPPTMPPPPSTQGAPRNSSYTPTTCEYRNGQMSCYTYIKLGVHRVSADSDFMKPIRYRHLKQFLRKCHHYVHCFSYTHRDTAFSWATTPLASCVKSTISTDTV